MSWLGKRVRNDGIEGTVIDDDNGPVRILLVYLDNDQTKEIYLDNNYGFNSDETVSWEWQSENGKWYRFSR